MAATTTGGAAGSRAGPQLRHPHLYTGAVYLSLVTIVVEDYDQAIGFYTGVLGFELAEDAPATTNDGRSKRWVVVRPPGAQTGLLLAKADSEEQAAVVGRQAAGRVGFFLHVPDFDAARNRLTEAGVTFVTSPRTLRPSLRHEHDCLDCLSRLGQSRRNCRSSSARCAAHR